MLREAPDSYYDPRLLFSSLTFSTIFLYDPSLLSPSSTVIVPEIHLLLSAPSYRHYFQSLSFSKYRERYSRICKLTSKIFWRPTSEILCRFEQPLISSSSFPLPCPFYFPLLIPIDPTYKRLLALSFFSFFFSGFQFSWIFSFPRSSFVRYIGLITLRFDALPPDGINADNLEQKENRKEKLILQ